MTYRSYGEFVSNGKTTNNPSHSRVAALKGHFDPWYRGFDLNYTDQRRADRFLSELNRMESEGDMPRLQIVRLPNDHTHGTSPANRTPRATAAVPRRRGRSAAGFGAGLGTCSWSASLSLADVFPVPS